MVSICRLMYVRKLSSDLTGEFLSLEKKIGDRANDPVTIAKHYLRNI